MRLPELSGFVVERVDTEIRYKSFRLWMEISLQHTTTSGLGLEEGGGAGRGQWEGQGRSAQTEDHGSVVVSYRHLGQNKRAAVLLILTGSSSVCHITLGTCSDDLVGGSISNLCMSLEENVIHTANRHQVCFLCLL